MIINPYRFAGAGVTFGNASRSFDGVDDYVEIADNADVPTGSQTIAFWMKLDTLTETVRPVTKFDGTGDQRSFLFAVLTDGTMRCIINQFGTSGGNNLIDSPSSTISTGAWYHVAMRFVASTEQTLYVNGTSVASDITSIPTRILDSTAPIQFGTEPTNISFFDGNIADVRIYDADIGATEVANLASGIDYQTNLVGWWLDDDDDVLDNAGTNDGTNNGSTYSTDGPLD